MLLWYRTSYIAHMNVSIIMSLYYKSLLTVKNLKYWTHRSIRGANLSQSRAEKNTNAIQYTGMLEVVQCCLVIMRRHEMCFMPFYGLSFTVDDPSCNVASALSDSKYSRMPLAHALPFTTWTAWFYAYSLFQMMNGRAHAECIGTISSHNCTGRTHGRKQAVKSSEPNDAAVKRTTLPDSQNHLSCITKFALSGWSNVILMQDHPHLLRCSAAYIIHMYIVDMLFGSMFTNGIGRTTDAVRWCSAVHFAHIPAP